MNQVNFKNLAAIKKRKKSKRLSYEDKCTLILASLEQQYRYLVAIGVKTHPGFTMSEIAKMSGYAKSAAFMNDLWRMADDGLLRAATRQTKSSGLSNVEFRFLIFGRIRFEPKTERML